MQFRNQSVLSMLMCITTKTFYITFWGSLVVLQLSHIFLQQLSLPYLRFTLTLWGSQICNFGINLYYLC